MSDIGMELKIKRIRKGLKQSDLGALTGVPQCVISRIENGKAEQYADQVEALSKELEVEGNGNFQSGIRAHKGSEGGSNG